MANSAGLRVSFVGDHRVPGMRTSGLLTPWGFWRRPLAVAGVRVVTSVAIGLIVDFDTGVLPVPPTIDCGCDRGFPSRSDDLPVREPADLALRAPGEAGTTWRLDNLLDPGFDVSVTPALSRCEAPLTTLPLRGRSGAEVFWPPLLSLLLRGLNE